MTCPQGRFGVTLCSSAVSAHVGKDYLSCLEAGSIFERMHFGERANFEHRNSVFLLRWREVLGWTLPVLLSPGVL